MWTERVGKLYADAKAFVEDNETRKERNFKGYKEARYALDPYKDFRI